MSDDNYQQAISTVDELIKQTQERIDSGLNVIEQCNKQMRVLKLKRKRLNKLKQEIQLKHLQQTTDE